ncbi:Protein CYP-33E2 [Aphelenchoides avenae]|nr:Protein CYP-33E2 [Aphelenchus avenae]
MLAIARLKPGYEAFRRWTEQYGPVYTYWVADRPVVAVTDFKLIHETFIKDADSYTGRYMFNEIMELLRGSINGVIITEGDAWRENRRFILQAFREYGMGREAVEEKILAETEYMISRMKSDLEAGVQEHNVVAHVDLAVGSVINQVLFGYRFSGEKEPEFRQIKSCLDAILVEMSNPISGCVAMCPSLRFFPPFTGRFEKFKADNARIKQFLRGQIDGYKHKFENEGLSESKDALPFVGTYLAAKEKSTDDVGHLILFRDDALLHFCLDLWNAGQETTSNTIAFAVLYLLLDQDVQERMQEELDKVVGPGEYVTTSHKAHLSYTNAVINEIQRLCNLIPQNLLHKTMKDVEVGGFRIPRGTLIVPQISSVLYDEQVFPEPYRFRPERFLDADGQLKKVDEFVPFSVGKRLCLGESLARMELFVFIANIFHAFKVLPVDPLNPPSAEKIAGFTVRPQPYMIRLQLRH